ncbi:MAG TPA: hypothetical protein VF331_23490 [Polyangiales bacterium]
MHIRRYERAVLVSVLAGLFSACGDGSPMDESNVEQTSEALTSSLHKYVFVIAMENHDANQIYGNTTDAPYINNTLIPAYARATNFNDELPSLVSEPHYVWMEAGTNAATAPLDHYGRQL